MLEDDPLAESETEGATADANSDKLNELHERAMRRFDSVAMPQQELRAQSLEARRFVTIQGAQWEGSWGEQFENAPRPEVDKITKSLEKIETDFRENRLTVDFLPACDNADDETADTLDGMHRADSYYFKAQQARDNAFQEAIRGGFGAYRLTVDKADPTDPDNDDLRVNPAMIIVDADQSVFFDGASKLYDKSDAQWAFLISADPRAAAEDKWGAENISAWPLTLWKYQYDWYTPDVVRTAIYYEIEHVADKLLTFTQGVSGETQRYYESEIEKAAIRDLKAQGWKVKTKPIKRKRVHKYIMNGTAVLKDCGFIAGEAIPIVPLYGRRDFVDNMERWRGHVSKMMDRQRIYNTRIGKMVETDSLAPREVPIFAPEQMNATIAAQWARQNIDRLPYLTVMPLIDPVSGGIASAGPIGKVEPPQLQPVTAALLQIASADLTEQDDTADQVASNVSADAMDLAAARVDAKSGIYLDNARQSFAREGEIYLGMVREVCFEPGRKVPTMTADGKDGTATIAEPFIDANKVYLIRNDLSQGSYKVVSDVQESTTTKRQKTVRQAMELSQAFMAAQSPQDALAALYTAAENMDGEAIHDLQSYYRQRAIAVGAIKPTPEEAQQLQEAAQNKQPDPQEIALQQQTQLIAAKAAETAARAQQLQAKGRLEDAQAQALEQAPKAPSGLSPAPTNPEMAAVTAAADAHAKIAGADLNNAKAEHLRHTMARENADGAVKRIATGHELALKHRQQLEAEHQGAHDRAMAEQQAQQPQGDAA